MAHFDRIIDDPEQAPDRRPAARRRLHVLLVALCGFLMILVLLSNPKVSTAIKGAGSSVSERVGQLLPMPETEPETVAAIPEPAPVVVVPDDVADNPELVTRRVATPQASVEKPPVRRMPQSRVPVRRLGAGH